VSHLSQLSSILQDQFVDSMIEPSASELSVRLLAGHGFIFAFKSFGKKISEDAVDLFLSRTCSKTLIDLIIDVIKINTSNKLAL
jgi:hypothetical protein